MERQGGERGAVVRLSPWADVVWGQQEGSAACLCAAFLPIEIMKGGALGRMCSHHSLSVRHQSSALCHPSPFSSSGPRRPRHCHHGHYLGLWHTTHSHRAHTLAHTHGGKHTLQVQTYICGQRYAKMQTGKCTVWNRVNMNVKLPLITNSLNLIYVKQKKPTLKTITCWLNTTI